MRMMLRKNSVSSVLSFVGTSSGMGLGFALFLMPYVVRTVGVTASCVYIVMAASVTLASLAMLATAALRIGGESYQDTVLSLIGTPAAKLLDVFLFIETLVTACLCWDLFRVVWKGVLLHMMPWDSSSSSMAAFLSIPFISSLIAALCLVIPLTLLVNYSKLTWWTRRLTLAATLLLAVIAVIVSAIPLPSSHTAVDRQPFDDATGLGMPRGTGGGFSHGGTTANVTRGEWLYADIISEDGTTDPTMNWHDHASDHGDGHQGCRLPTVKGIPRPLQLMMDHAAALAVILFFFCCHRHFFNVLGQIASPSKARVIGLLAVSTAIQTLFYVALAVAASFSLLDLEEVPVVPSEAHQSPPPPLLRGSTITKKKMESAGGDWATGWRRAVWIVGAYSLTVGRVVYCCGMVSSLALCSQMLRSTLMFFGKMWRTGELYTAATDTRIDQTCVLASPQATQLPMQHSHRHSAYLSVEYLAGGPATLPTPFDHRSPHFFAPSSLPRLDVIPDSPHRAHGTRHSSHRRGVTLRQRASQNNDSDAATWGSNVAVARRDEAPGRGHTRPGDLGAGVVASGGGSSIDLLIQDGSGQSPHSASGAAPVRPSSGLGSPGQGSINSETMRRMQPVMSALEAAIRGGPLPGSHSGSEASLVGQEGGEGEGGSGVPALPPFPLDQGDAEGTPSNGTASQPGAASLPASLSRPSFKRRGVTATSIRNSRGIFRASKRERPRPLSTSPIARSRTPVEGGEGPREPLLPRDRDTQHPDDADRPVRTVSDSLLPHLERSVRREGRREGGFARSSSGVSASSSGLNGSCGLTHTASGSGGWHGIAMDMIEPIEDLQPLEVLEYIASTLFVVGVPVVVSQLIPHVVELTTLLGTCLAGIVGLAFSLSVWVRIQWWRQDRSAVAVMALAIVAFVPCIACTILTTAVSLTVLVRTATPVKQLQLPGE